MQCAGNFAFTTDAGISEIIQPNGSVCGGDFTPQIRLRNFGSDPLTSVSIAWEWNGTQNNFTWTGNLTTGQSEVISLPLQNASGGINTFCSGSSAILTAITNGANIASYQWRRNGNNVGTNSSTFTATQAGSYTLEVTDVNGCSNISSAFVVNELASINIQVTTTVAGCGLNNGTASAMVNGTTAGYTFQWSTNPTQSGSTIGGLGFGSYTLIVTDNSTGCQESQNVVIQNANAPVIDSIVVSQPTCAQDLGAATTFVSGGNGNFTYNWTGSLPNSSNVSGLAAGNYTVDVTDNSSCAASASFTVGVDVTLDIDLMVTNQVSNAGDASIEAEVLGGIAPFSFSWNNSALSVELIENLSPGQYFVIATDSNGCAALSDTITIGSVSINDNNLVDIIQLYPNPTSSMLTISGQGVTGNILDVEVCNIIGQVILKETILHNGIINDNISLGGIAAGLYQVRIKAESQQMIVPIVKVD